MIWHYPRQPWLMFRCIQLHICRRYSSKPLAGEYRTIAQVFESSQPFDSDRPSLISVTGTVRTVRKQKKISFAAIGDGSTIQPLQVVLQPAQAEGYGKSIFTARLSLSTSSNYRIGLQVAHWHSSPGHGAMETVSAWKRTKP